MALESLVCPACGGPCPRGASTCSWCGAPVPPPVVAPVAPGPAGVSARRVFCPHCGGLYPAERDSCPRCPPVAEGSLPPLAKGSRCPACGSALAAESVGAAPVDRCTACGGTWFDRGDLARAMDLSTRGASPATVRRIAQDAEARAPAHDARRSLPCVRCRAPMLRRLVAPKGPAYVDVCARHGIWFDAGELEAFRGFVAAGGLEVARERDETGNRRRHRKTELMEPVRDPGVLPVILDLLSWRRW